MFRRLASPKILHPLGVRLISSKKYNRLIDDVYFSVTDPNSPHYDRFVSDVGKAVVKQIQYEDKYLKMAKVVEHNNERLFKHYKQVLKKSTEKTVADIMTVPHIERLLHEILHKLDEQPQFPRDS